VQSLASTITGVDDTNVNEPVDRVLETQAALARSPELLERVLPKSTKTMSFADFQARSRVEVAADADVIHFIVQAPEQNEARDLALRYASEFVRFRRQTALASLEVARHAVIARLHALRGVSGSGPLVQQLRQTEAGIRAREALQTPNAQVIRDNASAQKVRPTPLRNGLLAAAAAIVLGLGLALLLEILDPRVDAPAAIGAALDLPLLARLPERATRKRRGRLEALRDFASAQSEQADMLRLLLEPRMAGLSVRTLLVTGIGHGSEKAPVAVDLAVALAQASRSVSLVDLDLRHPTVTKMLDRDGDYGVTEVVRGEVGLERAVGRMAVSDRIDRRRKGSGEASVPDQSQPLAFVASGGSVDVPRSVVESRQTSNILAQLARESDFVIVNGPTLDHPDGLALCREADALLVVIRRSSARHRTLSEMRQILRLLPTPKIGLILLDPQVRAVVEVAADGEPQAGLTTGSGSPVAAHES
jgi:Mrp family chromosome partitioning ATPase/capsular polysaccharide biosynthesis protein